MESQKDPSVSQAESVEQAEVTTATMSPFAAEAKFITAMSPLNGGGAMDDDLIIGINASSIATPNFVVQRDANGRARVAAPSSSSDIARLAEVNAVEERVEDLETRLPVLSDAINSPASTTAASSKAVKAAYDKAVAVEKKVVPNERLITTTAPLTGGSDLESDITLGINATHLATPDAVIIRDARGRAKVAAPAAASDIARKEDVDLVDERVDGVEAKIPQLSDSVTSTSSTTAASSKAVKAAYDKAVSLGGSFVPADRTITTVAPLAGGGSMETDLVLSMDASSTATANHVVQRDAEGRAQIADPVAKADIANKRFVDSVAEDFTVQVESIIARLDSMQSKYDAELDGILARLEAVETTQASCKEQMDSVVSRIEELEKNQCACDGNGGETPDDGCTCGGENCTCDDNTCTCEGDDCTCGNGGEEPGGEEGEDDKGPGEAMMGILGTKNGYTAGLGIAKTDDGFLVSGTINARGGIAKLDDNFNLLGSFSVTAGGVSAGIGAMAASRDGGCVAYGGALHNGVRTSFLVACASDMSVLHKKAYSNGTNCYFAAITATPANFNGSAHYAVIGQQIVDVTGGSRRDCNILLFDKDLHIVKQATLQNGGCGAAWNIVATKDGFATVTENQYNLLLVTTFDCNLNLVNQITLATSRDTYDISLTKTSKGYTIGGLYWYNVSTLRPFILQLNDDLTIINEKHIAFDCDQNNATTVAATHNGNILFTATGVNREKNLVVLFDKEFNILKQFTDSGILISQTLPLPKGGFAVVGRSNRFAATERVHHFAVAKIKGDLTTLPPHFKNFPNHTIDVNTNIEVEKNLTIFTRAEGDKKLASAGFQQVTHTITTLNNPSDVSMTLKENI